MDETGQELLALLDGLPLALAQAALYLRETELNAATYVRFYKQQWGDLMKSDGEAQSPLVGYEQRSIGTTWTISFEAIRAWNEEAADLLDSGPSWTTKISGTACYKRQWMSMMSGLGGSTGWPLTK